jgi:hypothetical protein
MTDPETFLQEWSQENVTATVYDDRATAEELSSECLLDARVQEISEAELVQAAGGDLVGYMLSALNRAVDEVVNDRVARDNT